MYVTELVSFAVKLGFETKADEWMRVLVERRADCIETLDRERMHYEAIFKSVRNGRMFLSWFSVQGMAGATVKGSPHEIDELHMRYWKECIDRDFEPQKFDHVVIFVPRAVEQSVEARDMTFSTQPMS